MLAKTSAFLRSPLTRIALSLAVLAAIAFMAHRHFGFLENGWEELKAADNRWLLLAVVTVLLSMFAQAEVMVVLLRSAGIKVRRLSANVLGLVANAWSASLPGGPAISVAMIFREQLKWGATPVIASWYMVFSGLLAGAGMALLGIGSVFFLGLKKVDPLTLAVSLVVLVVLASLTNWAARNPKKVEDWLIARLRAFNRWRKKPEDRHVEQLAGFSEQLATVELPLPKLALAINWSLLNWILEIICLLACTYAVGAKAPIAGVVLSFISAKLIGQAQITPGGLGPVDIMLTSTLVAVAGLTSGQAFAAVIVFRMFSFVGLVGLGWITFLVAKLPNPRELTPATEVEAPKSAAEAAPSTGSETSPEVPKNPGPTSG